MLDPNNESSAELVDANAGRDATPVRKVRGRRVRPESEEFVLDDTANSDAPSADEADSLVRCVGCGANNRESSWDENDGDCPSCGAVAGVQRIVEEPPERLSEAELLFEMIGGEGAEEDEYVIKVDHLPNYHQDGKAHTTALKKFCRYLRGSEVTIDFMETVRRSCVCPCLPPGEEGRFLFTASKVNGKRGEHGFRKRWNDSITKPLPEEKPAVAAPVSPTALAAPQKSARDELTESVELLKTIHNIMGGSLRHNTPPLPPAEPDPFKAADASLELLTKAKSLFGDRDAGPVITGGDHHWSEGLLNGFARLLDSKGVVQFGTLLASALMAGANNPGTGAATPPSGPPPPPAAIKAPAPAPQNVAVEASPISAEALEVLGLVVAEIRGYESDEDSEQLDERAARAAAAVRTLPMETLALLDGVPPALLLPALIGMSPAWSDLAQMQDSGKFMDALLAELQKEPEEGTAGEPVEPIEGAPIN